MVQMDFLLSLYLAIIFELNGCIRSAEYYERSCYGTRRCKHRKKKTRFTHKLMRKTGSVVRPTFVADNDPNNKTPFFPK